MATALPPEVDGPITPANKYIFVDSVLPDSLVTVYADGANVGHITSTNPGWIFVPLTTTLAQNQKITATQNYQGSDPSIPVSKGESDHSAEIEVEPVPNPLPPLVFVSGLSTCMDSILMGGLIPGTEVDIHVGSHTGPLIVSGAVSQPTGVPPIQWFDLAMVAIPEGSTLYAQQKLGMKQSPMVPSPPVPGPPVTLGYPVEITAPARPCQMSLGLAKLTPGANITVRNNTTVIAVATVPWPAYTLAPITPLQPGTVSVAQTFARCYQVPAAGPKSAPVAAAPLPTPIVPYSFCADVKQLTISNLLAGEVLTLQRMVQTSSTTHTTSLIGAQGVSKDTVTVFLPKSFQPTDKGGPVSILVEVSLCGAPAPPPVVVPVAVVGSYPAPTIPAPVYACARTVLVQSAHPGSVIQVFLGKPPGVPLSNPVVAATSDLVVSLWTPLSAGESIFVQQTGCGADGTSPNIGVTGFSSLPTPQIDYPEYPPRPGATSVYVTSLYPGATVYLSVNDTPMTVTDATGVAMWIPTGAPLGDQQVVKVFQTLCGQISHAVSYMVAIGTLDVVYNPPTLTRGQSNALVVWANDTSLEVTDPSRMHVDGLPVMVSVDFDPSGKPTGPAVSGITGTYLSYTPGSKDGQAVAFVFGGRGYKNAYNSIALVDALKVWVEDVTPVSAVVFGSGFLGPSQTVTVDALGFVPAKRFTGDITMGIPVTIDCTASGQVWTFNAQSTSGGPTVPGNITCLLS